MTYLTCCVNSTANAIRATVEQAREISYKTARKSIGGEVLDEWAQLQGYDINNQRGGLRLRNDWHVSYYRSKYKGRPCVYVRHSAIEHIFV